MRFCGNCGARLPEFEAPPPGRGVRTPAQTGALMNRGLAERFQQAGRDAIGQRRNVTLMYVELAGYSELVDRLDTEDLYELLQQFLNMLANDVYKYEGTVDKFIGNGLMAIFGAPIANENNAELAARAALEMRQDMARYREESQLLFGLNLDIKGALHSGVVVVNGIGSDLVMDYMAYGTAMPFTRRLMEAAPPGTILVSENVRQAIAPLFDLHPLENLELKEFPPTTAYQLRNLKTAPKPVRGVEGLRAPMIGRDAELGQLRALVSNLLRNNRGQFVLIHGEAGIGKSRLLAELQSQLGANIGIFQGHAQAYQNSIQYHLFHDLFESYLGCDLDAPENRAREALREKVKAALSQGEPHGRAEDMQLYLEHLLNLPPSSEAGAGLLRLLNPEQLRQQVFFAVRDLFLAEAARRPLILIFEDAHWIDETSLHLIQFLLESVSRAPLLVIATSRHIEDGPVARLIDWTRQNLIDHFTAIQLQSLQPDQSEELLLHLLSLHRLPATFRMQILERAAGNPFFLEEILRMLIDEGYLRREKDGYWLQPGTNLANLGVPASLEALILARFDRLGPAEKRLLQIASVIGYQFSLPLLKEVLRRMEPLEHWEELSFLISFSLLIDREFIITRHEVAGGEYRFKHFLLADAICSTLLKRDRGAYHSRVAAAIESLYADRLSEKAELLAHHYLASQQGELALPYLIQAGQKTAAEYASAEARQYFEQALALLDEFDHTLEQALTVRTGLGDVLILTGEYLQARQHLQAALNLLEKQAEDGFIIERIEILRKIGVTYERQGSYEEALDCLSRAQVTLRQTEPLWPVENAQILNDLGHIYFRQGDLDLAEQNLLQALALVEDSGRPEIIASIYNRLGGVCYQKDQPERASEYVHKSLVLWEQAGDRVAVARAYNNLGLLAWQSDQWELALKHFTRSVELNTGLGDVEAAILLHINIGTVLMDMGELEQARQHLDLGLQQAERIGHSFLEGMAYHHLSRLCISAGEWDQALRFGENGLKVLTEIGAEDSNNLADLHISMGEAWLGLHSLDRALEAGENAASLLALSLQGDHPSPQTIRLQRLSGYLAIFQGEYDLARRLLNQSVEGYERHGNRLEAGRSYLALAYLAREMQDPPLLREQIEQAEAIFEKLGARRDLEKARALKETID